MTSGRIGSAGDLDRFRDAERERLAHRKLAFLVCGGAGCIASGAEQIVEAIRREMPSAGVEITSTGCM